MWPWGSQREITQRKTYSCVGTGSSRDSIAGCFTIIIYWILVGFEIFFKKLLRNLSEATRWFLGDNLLGAQKSLCSQTSGETRNIQHPGASSQWKIQNYCFSEGWEWILLTTWWRICRGRPHPNSPEWLSQNPFSPGHYLSIEETSHILYGLLTSILCQRRPTIDTRLWAIELTLMVTWSHGLCKGIYMRAHTLSFIVHLEVDWLLSENLSLVCTVF